MPDFKYYSAESGKAYSGIDNYFNVAAAAIEEMYRQVGDLVINSGIARRGLLVRHLILPGLIEDSKKIIDYIAGKFGSATYLNLMDQYRPAYLSSNFNSLNRRISGMEFSECIDYAQKKGFRRPEWLYG
jgi:putative pyruvate formate lyase activating enzyme